MKLSRRSLLLFILPVLFGVGASFLFASGISQPGTSTRQKLAQATENLENAVEGKATPPPYKATKLCELQDEAIDECSGLAASRRYPGYLWMHNDSGDEARLFLVSQHGQTVAQVKLAGANSEDWEDMAIAGTEQNAWLYAGDIGDNAEGRAQIVIYRLREPVVNLQNAPQTLTLPCEKMTLTYADGPHNAETLIATPQGEIIIVTKTTAESMIFKTPQPFKANTTQKLVQVGRFQFGHVGFMTRMTTAGDLSPDGKRLVVSTYAEAYEWTLPAIDPWKTFWKTTPKVITLPRMKQSEAICYSADGKRLYVSSEQRPTPLYALDPQ